MAVDILDDIIRIRRLVADAARDHDNGKDIGDQLSSVAAELGHLLEKAESRLEAIEEESLDARTRFVAELAGSLLRAMMAQRGGAIAGSEVETAVDMAAEIVKHVKARY